MSETRDPILDILEGEPPDSAAIDVGRWLIAKTLGTPNKTEIFVELIERIRSIGIPVDRAQVAHTTLHPLYSGFGATWSVDGGTTAEAFTFDRDPEQTGWVKSPVRWALAQGDFEWRARIPGPEDARFPLLAELGARGYTDYLLTLRPFDSFRATAEGESDAVNARGAGMAVSWATRRGGGFSDDDLSAIRWIAGPMAVLTKTTDFNSIARTIAECYIGRDAGPRVLSGAVRRGDFSETQAVVWMSDLRDSTKLAASYPLCRWIPMLNLYFDATVGAVVEEGGEPLTYIGDGALAIFPVEVMGQAGARQAAIRAKDRALDMMSELNAARRAEGEPAFRWGLGLHAGRLGYGGIGVPERQSWSVIGPVVNEAARIEALTKEVGEPVLASAAFVSGLGAKGWRSCGRHALKGVADPLEVFAPPPAD